MGYSRNETERCSPARRHSPSPRKAKVGHQPKTPWGDPDIQGIWPGTAMVGTPLERDKSLGTRAFLTEDEFKKREERAKTQAAVDSEETVSDLTKCDPGRGSQQR